MPLTKVLAIPHNMSLQGILNTFQDGRSHMAIVSGLSINVEKAVSVKKAVKKNMAQRIMDSVGISESSDSSDSDEEGQTTHKTRLRRLLPKRSNSGGSSASAVDTDITREGTLREGVSVKDFADNEGSGGKGSLFGKKKSKSRKRARLADIEMGVVDENKKDDGAEVTEAKKASLVDKVFSPPSREQSTPSDAILRDEDLNKVSFL